MSGSAAARPIARVHAGLLGEIIADTVMLAVRVPAMLGRAIWRRLEAERIYAELMVLDDRALADIGLARVDIPRVANGTYRGREDRGAVRMPTPAPALLLNAELRSAANTSAPRAA